MKLIHKIAAVGIIGFFTQGALANHPNIAYARVVDSKPIYEWVEQRTPAKHCWVETVREEHTHSNQRASTVVLGSVIGGAIGHAVGHGHKNKKVGTAVGAILGAAIGSDIERSKRGSTTYNTQYRDEERCEYRDKVTTVEHLVGYDVTYQYNGQRYTTRMQNHPGDRIKVAVDVRPLSY